MMKGSKNVRNLVMITLVIAVSGALRMPLEQGFTEDLRERKMIPPQISSNAWSEMGQTSLAGVFGGLRSVMASMLSLKAYGHFEENEWYQLQRDFEVITTLDPYNAFYWSHGGWHIGYNAASWARSNREFSPERRKATEMSYLEAGDAFYRKGLEYLPESAGLWFEIGSMWSNKHKRPDLPRAAEAFAKARFSGNSIYKRRFLFTISRIPGREVEAYEEALRLYAEYPQHVYVPSFRCLLVVLSSNPDLPQDALRFGVKEMWPDLDWAYMDLYNYRQRVLEDDYYSGELDKILRDLIVRLNVPDKLNPFKTRTRLRITRKEWRKEFEPSEEESEQSE